MELQLIPHIESLIFASEYPITVEEITEALRKSPGFDLDEEAIIEYLDYIILKYNQEDFGIQIVKMINGYCFMTKAAYHSTITAHLKNLNKKKLSKASLESLAIIAYKQPVTKPEIERIRGVNCDYVLQKLLEKELIIISGRNDSPGRPLLYKTSERFLDYFGLNDLTDLPKLRDFELPKNTIGNPIDVMTLDEENIPGPIPKASPSITTSSEQ